MDKETLDFVFTVLDNRINTFNEDLENLEKLKKEENDLHPVVIDDVGNIIEVSMNVLNTFKKELLEEVQNKFGS